MCCSASMAFFEITFNQWHSLKPFVLLDFNSDYEIDTNGIHR